MEESGIAIAILAVNIIGAVILVAWCNKRIAEFTDVDKWKDRWKDTNKK